MAKMQVSHHLDGDVETVFALVTNPDFLERKFTAGGAKDVSADCVDADGGGRTVVVRRHVTVDLPAFAKRFIQPTNSVVQSEEWSPPDETGRRTCTYRIDVQGVPSHIDGTVTLSADGGGTRQDIDAQVKVSIPIVGGKLEGFAVDSGKKLLSDEAEFTNRELGAR